MHHHQYQLEIFIYDVLIQTKSSICIIRVNDVTSCERETPHNLGILNFLSSCEHQMMTCHALSLPYIRNTFCHHQRNSDNKHIKQIITQAIILP